MTQEDELRRNGTIVVTIKGGITLGDAGRMDVRDGRQQSSFDVVLLFLVRSFDG